ncbi:beta-1,6-N-acetylglucosaminyltransferase [Neobacillus niacini]|uniref:beta-1,6-N-acetylglucosaminyltransferase n=1 Tax=Neobacillus niacini TaxID=86668 RepID=UPI003000E20A
MFTSLRTAFIIQIHKNPEQVNKFITQLIAEGQADVFVHIDKKNYEKLHQDIFKSPNVRVLQYSINCEWGDISQVDTTILLLREVLASKNKYDFVCLRSGQDLLVKDGFKDYLMNNKNKIFMNNRQMSDKDLGFMKINWPKITRKRYTTTHPIRIYRKLLLNFYSKGLNIYPNINKWPKELSFYKGSQWFTVPFEVAKYIIEFLNENVWYYRFFENSLVPDESFFHTLIMNSHFKSNVINNNLMFLKWGETLSGRNSPQDLTSEDLNKIVDSNQYFARKFDEDIDNSVIDYFANNVNFGSGKKSDPKKN